MRVRKREKRQTYDLWLFQGRLIYWCSFRTRWLVITHATIIFVIIPCKFSNKSTLTTNHSISKSLWHYHCDLPKAAFILSPIIHGIDMTNSFLFAREKRTTKRERHQTCQLSTGIIHVYPPCSTLERLLLQVRRSNMCENLCLLRKPNRMCTITPTTKVSCYIVNRHLHDEVAKRFYRRYTAYLPPDVLGRDIRIVLL